MTSRIRRGLAWAVVVPPVLALLCPLTVTIAEISGLSVFAAVQPRNMAEAAAIGRADDVIRRVGMGEALFRVYDLRPEMISSAVVRATPAEAAMWSRQLLMIELLDREGAIGDAARRRELACLAIDLELNDVAAYLSPGGSAGCVPGEGRERVLARSAGGRAE